MKKLFTFKNFLKLFCLEILFVVIMTLIYKEWTGFIYCIGIILLQCFILVAFVIIKGIVLFIKKPKGSKMIYIKFFFGFTLLNIFIYLLAVITLKKVEFSLITLLVEKPITGVFMVLVLLCFRFDLSAFKSKNEE